MKNLPLPHIDGENSREQIEELRKYLIMTIQEINFALNDLERRLDKLSNNS